MEDPYMKANGNGGLLKLNGLVEYLACSYVHAAKLIPFFKIASLRCVWKPDLDAHIESRLAARG